MGHGLISLYLTFSICKTGTMTELTFQDHRGDYCSVNALTPGIQGLPAIISFLIFGSKYFKRFSGSIILLIAIKEKTTIFRGWTHPSNLDISVRSAQPVPMDSCLCVPWPWQGVTCIGRWRGLSTLARMCCPFILQTFTEHPSLLPLPRVTYPRHCLSLQGDACR